MDGIFFVIIGIEFGKGYRKNSLFGIIFLPYWGILWGIRFDDDLLLSSFPHSGLVPKGLNVGVKRPECFNGHVSPLGFIKWA